MSFKLSLTLTSTTQNVTELYLHEIEKYKEIRLKSIYIQHETDANKLFVYSDTSNLLAAVSSRPIFVHCSLLRGNDNFIDDQKSDIIAILFPENKPRKNMFVKFSSNTSKQIIPNNYIRMHMTNFDGKLIENDSKFIIFYELEFS